MAYEEVTGTPIKKLDVNEVIEGKFKGFKTGTYGDNPVLETSEGEQVLAGDTALLTKMKTIEESAGLDKQVRITRLPDAKGKTGRVYHDYKVEIDK